MRAVWTVVCVHVCGAGPACRAHPSTLDDVDSAADASAIAYARGLANPTESLGPRERALAVAASVEAQAEREGAGVRAANLRANAARLRERVWRVYGVAGDGREALRLYRAAAGELANVAACEVVLDAAGLAGDLAGDPARTLAELETWRQHAAATASIGASSSAECAHSFERLRSLLTSFVPPGSRLDDADAPTAAVRSVSEPTPAPPVAPPRVVAIEEWPGPDVARVVIVLDREAPYRTGDEPGTAERAPTTFVDLDGVDLGSAPREVSESGVLTRLRADATITGSRVALDLDGEAWRRTFYMREPYRIIIDVARHPPADGARAAPRVVSRVVLDAGHGGKDTGAVGGGGLAEKDVTLDLARRAKYILAAEGLEVFLTRDDDRYVSLEERTARANAFGADLFLSLHCNASEGRGRRGIEAYVLDAARDEVVARLAARENATTPAATADLATMLGRLRLADHADRSRHFAGLLERAAMASVRMRYADVPDGGVHPAGFYVLVGARMPSVLLETSYISNAVDERRLASEDYRQSLADAVANAVRAYREGR